MLVQLRGLVLAQTNLTAFLMFSKRTGCSWQTSTCSQTHTHQILSRNDQKVLWHKHHTLSTSFRFSENMALQDLPPPSLLFGSSHASSHLRQKHFAGGGVSSKPRLVVKNCSKRNWVKLKATYYREGCQGIWFIFPNLRSGCLIWQCSSPEFCGENVFNYDELTLCRTSNQY